MNPLKSTTLVLLLCATLLGLSACSGGGAAAPATKPTVQILAPAYGASVMEGDVVSVQAVASDAGGITRVELYVDGQLANTKLSPNAQGDALFNATLEWLASKPGAHTLGVRAFNAADAWGEITIPIAVNPRVGGVTPVAVELTPVTAQDNTPATDATEAPTDVANATDAPTDTIPTEAAPTDIPPTDVLATATLPPFAAQLPTDGGANVSLNWSDDGLYIEANANDSRVGGDNGDGIAFVEIFVQDLTGKIIAFQRDTTAPYCYFGDDNNACNTVQPGTNEFVWRPGVPIRAGWYFVRAIAHTPDNHILVAEQPLRLNNPPDSFQDVFADIFVEQQTDDVQGELSLRQTSAARGPMRALNGSNLQLRFTMETLCIRAPNAPRAIVPLVAAIMGRLARTISSGQTARNGRVARRFIRRIIYCASSRI